MKIDLFSFPKYKMKQQSQDQASPQQMSNIIPQQSQNSLLTSSPVFRQYGYRIIITLLYSTASIINGMCWVVVTPIAVPIQQAYGVSAALVAFIPMSYLIFYVLVNFPSNWIIDVKGIKKGVVIGATLTFLGCAIRCLVKVSFTFVIVGQIFCSFAQPLLINAPMKIATRWFMPQNRSLAMAILTVVNIIGTAVGFLIPSFFVDKNDQAQKVRQNFFLLMIVEAIIAAVSTILIAIFFKQSPLTLPSLGSMAEQTDFFQSIKQMFQNRKFMLLALSFGVVNGTFNIYGSLMDDILDPYGFNNDQVSQFGVALMVTGIISAGLFGLYVQKTLKYSNAFKICSIVGLLTTAGFPLCLKYATDTSKFYPLYLSLIICQGFVFIPLQPLTIDYGSDTMFPIGQANITGIMLSFGQIFGIFFVQAAQLIFKLGDKDLTTQQKQVAAFNSVVFCNAFLAVGCVVLMLQNGQLKRANLEKGKGSLHNQNQVHPDLSSMVTNG